MLNNISIFGRGCQEKMRICRQKIRMIGAEAVLSFVKAEFSARLRGFGRSALHNRRIFAILNRIPAGRGVFIFAAQSALFS